MNLFKKIFSKSRSLEDGIFFGEIQKILGFNPVNLNNYRKAFTHRSANKTDSKGKIISYERLEFLGDAMLSSVIAAHLFKEVPAGDEGYLTKMRSKIVSREHLNELGKDLNLIRFLESKIQFQSFGENIHGNIFEAFVGAIYEDLGYEYCHKFIHKKVIKPYVNISRLEGKVISYKSLVIEWCQKEKKTFLFEAFEDNSISGARLFGVKLSIDEKVVAKGRATSKKKAEEIAAQRAYYVYQSHMEKK